MSSKTAGKKTGGSKRSDEDKAGDSKSKTDLKKTKMVAEEEEVKESKSLSKGTKRKQSGDNGDDVAIPTKKPVVKSEKERPKSSTTVSSAKSTSSKKVVKKTSKTVAPAKASNKGAVVTKKPVGTKSAPAPQKGNEDKTPKFKKMTKLERLEEARQAFKWWEAPELEDGINWKSLEHPGILFAPPYVPHNVPFRYDGKVVMLTSEQEELASFYAAMPEDGPQLGNPATREVFQRNFFDDFKESFVAGSVVKNFKQCDFSAITEHLDVQKNLRKAATTDEKEEKKQDKEELQLKYQYSLIDGRLEKMGNYNMEPPGLFRGRGEHPKTGKVKTRCFPESVTVNLSKDACVPRCGVPGHAWEGVQHDPSVTWLCSWQENVQSQYKYVMLAASSSFKGKSDRDKYGKAIELKGCIQKVRDDYKRKIKDKDLATRQLGTAMWVIDVLALRVGGEKGDDEADTVGCCSLRREHLTFVDPPESKEIELEFLGKDSMLFKQTINFALYGDLGLQVYSCLRSFCSKKGPSDDVFEYLKPEILNKHLHSLMPGLTAKVFRTFNASITLEKELPDADALRGLSIQDKVLQYNAANRQVAILCNHQKTVSKAAETMFENLNEKLETLKKQQREMTEWKSLVKKSAGKIPLAKDDGKEKERLQKALQDATVRKEAARTTEEKLSSQQAIDDAKAEIKLDAKKRMSDKHMFKTKPTEDSIASRIEKWAEDIRKLEVDIRNRDENKEVALGTSKINYMDPRISVAWCKRCEVPIDKIFAKTLRDKFNWAMAVPPNWKFEKGQGL